MTAPCDLMTAAARRVGEAARHDRYQDGTAACYGSPDDTYCGGCRAEAAALVELRRLLERAIDVLTDDVEELAPMLEAGIDHALGVLRALGEPAEGKHE